MRISSRLSLRYEKGSFGLTRINTSADNQNLLNLALAINSLQTDELKDVLRIERFLLI